MHQDDRSGIIEESGSEKQFTDKYFERTFNK
jgi:hypothetical protein